MHVAAASLCRFEDIPIHTHTHTHTTHTTHTTHIVIIKPSVTYFLLREGTLRLLPLPTVCSYSLCCFLQSLLCLTPRIHQIRGTCQHAANRQYQRREHTCVWRARAQTVQIVLYRVRGAPIVQVKRIRRSGHASRSPESGSRACELLFLTPTHTNTSTSLLPSFPTTYICLCCIPPCSLFLIFDIIGRFACIVQTSIVLAFVSFPQLIQ